MNAPMTSESNESKSRRNRRAIVGLAVVVVAAAAAYFASPLAALYALKSAMQSGSKDQLDALVDFPAVRDDLKSQFNARIVEAMNQPDMKDNPFAGLAAVLAPAFVGHVIDAAVTPDGLSTLIRDGRISRASDQKQPSSSPKAGEPTVARVGYLTLDRFKASLDNGEKPPTSISLVLERRGLFTWKLVKIELPADAFPENSADADDAEHAPTAAELGSSPNLAADEGVTPSDDAAVAQRRYEEQRQYEEEQRLQRIRDHDARVSCYTHGGPPC